VQRALGADGNFGGYLVECSFPLVGVQGVACPNSTPVS
jgi:hypothetical protein